MTSRSLKIVVSLTLLLAGGLLLFFNSRPVNLGGEIEETSSSRSNKNSDAIAVGIDEPPEANVELDSRYNELEGYGVSPKGVKGDLQLVQNLIFTFHTYVKKDGELPTAGNRELMKAMMGDNAYKMRFVHDDFEFLNENGEIIDRWGSPLSFHFETYKCPDVRSLGPDGKAWTADDIILKFE